MFLDNDCAATGTAPFTCTAVINSGSMITLQADEICDMNDALSFNGAQQIGNVNENNDSIRITCPSSGGLITAQAIDNNNALTPVIMVTVISCVDD